MLSDAFLSRLDTLRLAMRGRASGGAGGARRSRKTGSSAEFSDYREYIPGDDIRRIDWNAMARFDKIFLKLFMEEQESAVTVLLDGSESMREKWDAACRAAEALGYLALTGGDRLRLFLLREDGIRPSPQLSGRPEGLPKGLCFLISDCYGEEGIATALDSLRFRKQECAVIQPLSPFELDPALDGALRLTDSETGEKTDLLADREALESYRRALEDFLKVIRETCFRRETPYVLLDAGQDFEQEFIPLLSRSHLLDL